MRRLLLAVFLLFTAGARAEPFAVRVADLPTYGRIIIRLAHSRPPTVTQAGDQVTIASPGTEFATPEQVPRNVVTYAGGHGSATLTMVPGARLKTEQHGNIFVVVALDPATRSIAGSEASRPNPAILTPTAAQIGKPAPPAPAPDKQAVAPSAKPEKAGAAGPDLARPADPRPTDWRPADPHPAPSPVSTPAPSPEAVSPPAHTAEPAPPEAQPPAAPPPPHQTETAATHEAPPEPESPAVPTIRIEAGPEVGAVAFRRGSLGFVVLDDALPVSLDDEDVDRLASAHVETFPHGTMLTVELQPEESLALTHERDAWIIRLAEAKGTPAAETPVADGIAFQFAQPGRAMTVSDPVTGQVILLGTVRRAGPDRTVIEERRSAPGYVLLPTWLGLALEANADAVDLRPTATGFTLQIPDRTAPAKTAAAVLSNPFGIPNAPIVVLKRQLDGQIASAAAAAPRSRGRERVAAARSMLALGMAAEAQAVLTLAGNDDPAIANDPSVAALSGIAAVLAGRPGEAGGLDSPGLLANADISMWRSLRDAALGKPAPALGSAWPVLATYPAAIRQHIAPEVMEAAAKSGVALPESELAGPSFAMARAEQQAVAGETAPALEQFDAISNGRDERESVRATRAAIDLRLVRGEITPATAADRLERLTVRWRGDYREIALRLQVAALRIKAGQWRAALESLQQTEKLFPDTKDQVAARRADVFRTLLAADSSQVDPLEFVAVAGDFADSLPSGADGERLAALLAEKLAALDLPDRAIPVLQRLMDRADSPAKKAEFGLRLAQLRLDAGDPVKAEATLADVDPVALNQANAERRIMLLARAKADRGDPAAAAAELAAIDTPSANEFRASLLAKAGDWSASLAVLQTLAAKTVPDEGPLDQSQQDLVLREATAAVQAGDGPALTALRRFDGRLTAPRLDLFRVLTATAIRGAGDLPRAAKELAATRSLPARLSSMR